MFKKQFFFWKLNYKREIIHFYTFHYIMIHNLHCGLCQDIQSESANVVKMFFIIYNI